MVSTPVNADVMIACVGANALGDNVNVSSIVETGVNWTGQGNPQILKQLVDGGKYYDVEIWYGIVGSGASASITVTLYQSLGLYNGAVASISEYSGLALSSFLDKTASNSSTSSQTSDTGTTATTFQAVELDIGASLTASQHQSVPTNGFTLVNDSQTTPDLAYLEKIVSTTGSANTGTTIANFDDYCGCIATFKANSSYAPPPPTRWENSNCSGYDAYGPTIEANDWSAQTFTVGSTAHSLTSVYANFYLDGPSANGNITIGIRATLGGVPTGSDLTNGTLDVAGLYFGNPTWTEIAVKEYTLSANTQYAIVFRYTDLFNAAWAWNASNPYSGGSAYISSNSGSTWNSYAGGTADFLFQIVQQLRGSEPGSPGENQGDKPQSSPQPQPPPGNPAVQATTTPTTSPSTPSLPAITGNPSEDQLIWGGVIGISTVVLVSAVSQTDKKKRHPIKQTAKSWSTTTEKAMNRKVKFKKPKERKVKWKKKNPWD